MFFAWMNLCNGWTQKRIYQTFLIKTSFVEKCVKAHRDQILATNWSPPKDVMLKMASMYREFNP